jgi:excisionase family DNA binding protein
MSNPDHPANRGAMSVEDFARWAGIGRTTAWHQIRLGHLRAVKVGGRTLVKLEDAHAWLAALPEVQRRPRRCSSRTKEP